MKKLVTLLLTAALAITAATTAFADDITPGADGKPNPSSKQIDVTYTVTPSYTVTIPATIALDSQTKQGTASVTATNVTIPHDKALTVAISSNTDFKVKIGDGTDAPTLKYQVTKRVNNSTTETSVDKTNNTVLEVKSGSGSTELTFKLIDNVVYSGTYTGTVTFTVSVN